MYALSPSAPSFQPPDGLEFAIFNDGVPSSVYYGCHPEHDVVQHIPDEAIEELFPPSAEEVAEMEAADDFVETMAWLSYLDECDEAARFSFAGYGKRWAARRSAGLVGKPHPPRARPARSEGSSDDGGVLLASRHRSGTVTSASEIASSSLVPYVPPVYEARPRKVGMMYGVPKGYARGGMRGHRAPIQQPRKHY